MIVMKFGGTSVEDERAIIRVASIVLGRLEERPVVVVSAMAGRDGRAGADIKRRRSGLSPRGIEATAKSSSAASRGASGLS